MENVQERVCILCEGIGGITFRLLALANRNLVL